MGLVKETKGAVDIKSLFFWHGKFGAAFVRNEPGVGDAQMKETTRDGLWGSIPSFPAENQQAMFVGIIPSPRNEQTSCPLTFLILEVT